MRKLLNTLFVTSEDSYLALENENVVVINGENKLGQFPLSILEGIVCFSYKGASPALMGACAGRGIQLCFMTPRGRFLARVCGEDRGNVLLRKQQYRVSDSLAESCLIARNMILGKVFNARWVLERTLRDHGMRVDTEALRKVSTQLAQQLPAIETAVDLDTLRGLEGEASARYFSGFNQLILNQKDDFSFEGRNRHPPRDNVNAMLSFAYTLLANDCGAALESVGLDSYVGFMHRDKPGRASLALDLMEELRAPLADRLVLTLINNRMVQKNHFRRQADGVVLLNDDGRKLFLNAWQERKRDAITHPYLQEKVYWGLVPYVQALLLARYLRGDLDGYPTFFWK
ncbi:MAG: type I-C CRISPR-associated endonuclease Cas1 [Clostridia bacterium]|nr:type I-C CRISPR-associated endonuclease Cas1 [Clostridia bacterium]